MKTIPLHGLGSICMQCMPCYETRIIALQRHWVTRVCQGREAREGAVFGREKGIMRVGSSECGRRGATINTAVLLQ